MTDYVAVYNNSGPAVRTVCGAVDRLEMVVRGPQLYIEFRWGLSESDGLTKSSLKPSANYRNINRISKSLC